MRLITKFGEAKIKGVGKVGTKGFPAIQHPGRELMCPSSLAAPKVRHSRVCIWQTQN